MITRRKLIAGATAVGAVSPGAPTRAQETKRFIAQGAHLTMQIPTHWSHTPPLPWGIATVGASDGFVYAVPVAESVLETVPANAETVVWRNMEVVRIVTPQSDSEPAAITMILPNPNPIATWSGTATHLAIWVDPDHFDSIMESITFGLEDVAPSDLTMAILDVIEARSYFRDAVAWSNLRNKAVMRKSQNDVADFIRYHVLSDLKNVGDHHSFVLDVSGYMSTVASATEDSEQIPTSNIIAGMGLLRFPGNLGLSPERLKEYVDVGCRLRNELHSQGVNGWIIDLRGMNGGSVHHPLTVLYPFLPDGRLVGLIDGYGNETWIKKQGTAISPPAYLLDYGDHVWPEDLADPAIPVAVLTGPFNGSAGEMTQLALMSRDNLQTFGGATAGFTTANGGMALFDGSALGLATSAEMDAEGNAYTGSIEPDVYDPTIGNSQSTSADDLAIVLDWLRKSGSR